jgi:Na+/H+ antiporter NhaD/arsenite permease-like protein
MAVNSPSFPPGVPFFRNSADTTDAWDEPEVRHAQHRRQLVVLGVFTGLLLLATFFVHPAFGWLVAAIGLVTAIELVMLRSTRPTSKIPDFRTPEERNDTRH